MTAPLQEVQGFEWDEDKARSNQRKHRVSFLVASGVFLDEERLEDLDGREEYGEERFVTVGLVKCESPGCSLHLPGRSDTVDFSQKGG